MIGFAAIAAALLAATLWWLLRPLRRAGGNTGVQAALLLALPAATLLLYAWLGHPDALADDREAVSAELSAAMRGEAQPSPRAYAELQNHLQRQPRDARALVLKGRIDLQAGRHEAAALAFGRATKAEPSVARDPEVWLDYAEAVGLQQGGSLQGEPERLVAKALELAPGHPRALDLSGSAAWERGDFNLAARRWQALLAQMPEGSARMSELRAAISRAEQRAKLALPAG